MSFQGSVNQLLGSANALFSLNPNIQADIQERREIEKLGRQEELLKKQEKLSTEQNQRFFKAQQMAIKEYGNETNPIAGAIIQGAEDAYTSTKQETLAITKEQEAVARSLFKLDPTEENLDKLMGAKATAVARGNLENQIRQREEFRSFWDNLNKTVGPTSYNKAHEYYDKSSPVGGKK